MYIVSVDSDTMSASSGKPCSYAKRYHRFVEQADLSGSFLDHHANAWQISEAAAALYSILETRKGSADSCPNCVILFLYECILSLIQEFAYIQAYDGKRLIVFKY